MTKLQNIIIAIIIFMIGYTLGQGHKPLDFNGDGRISGLDWLYVKKELHIK